MQDKQIPKTNSTAAPAGMVFYKDVDGEIYAFDDTDAPDITLKELTEITDPQEIEAILNPEIKPDALAKAERAKRNAELASTDYAVLMYLEQGLEIPEDIKQYRQALRDIPEQSSFPTGINWPVKVVKE